MIPNFVMYIYAFLSESEAESGKCCVELLNVKHYTYSGSNYVQNSSQITLLNGMDSFLEHQHFAVSSGTLSLWSG